MRRAFWLGLVLAGLLSLVLGGPAAAHAQLVSSTPGAGEVLAESPTEIQIVFSDRVDPAFAGLDLLDADGAAIGTGIGEPDATDPHLFVAPIEPLAEGLYTVNWHVLSADDGHVTEGSFSFGIGNVEAPSSGMGHAMGGLHVGQSQVIAVLDVVSRAVGYLGLLLAFGLFIIGSAVVRPAIERWPRALGLLAIGALALAALGAVGGLVVGISAVGSFTGTPMDYVTGSRTGLLLGSRFIVGALGALLGLALLGRNPRATNLVGASAAVVGLGLAALGSHANAEGAIGPVVTDVVHMAAAGVWLSGIVCLVLLAGGQLGSVPPNALRIAVPRFSALAVVAVGLVVATGLYASWLQVRDLAGLGTDYGLVLLAKLALAGTAVGFGAINFFDAGRNWAFLGGLRRRVMLEVALASVVLVLTANITGGTPPAAVSVVDVPAVSGSEGVALGFQAGQPGPNRAVVTPPMPSMHGGTVEMDLARLDAGTGAARIQLRPDPNDPHGERLIADGILLPADSSWSATVVGHDMGGAESWRARFAFGMTAGGLEVDRGISFDLGMLLAGAVIIGALGGLGFWLGGGGLPGTDRQMGRPALLIGSLIGLVLAGLMLFAGPAA